MRITIALLVATTALAHIGGTVARSTDMPANMTSHQEPWTPVKHQAGITNKQDGGESQQYLDPSQQILVIAPGREAGAGAGLSYTYQLPARGEVINTAPKDAPQPPGPGAVPQSQDSHAMLQPAGSGVVLQIHPQYLKGYPANQNLRPVQGGGGAHGGYTRNPQVAGTQVALQIQPQFVLTGVHNPGGLHKQIQAPIYYNQPLNSAPVAVNYPNHLLAGGARPGQQQVLTPPLGPPNPGVLAQLAAAQYPQLFPVNQHVKVQNHPLGTKPPPLPQQQLHPHPHPQQAVTSSATAGETKVRPHTRDTSSDEIFPDFGKMFENYFKTEGPFVQSFRNDNPENVEKAKLKANTNDDFPTGDFFGYPDKSNAASNNQQQKQQQDHNHEGGFQPCDFFKAANQKVVESESDENEDSEQFSSDKHAARDFGPPRGDSSEEAPETKSQRHRGNRDDDDGPRPGHRNHDDDSGEEDDEESPRHHQRHRPSQSQRSQSYRGKKESDDHDEEDDDNRRPANFHHHHHHHHDGRPSSQKKKSKKSGGHHARPSQEYNSDSYHGRPSQEHNTGTPSGRQEHNSYHGRPSQEHGHSGRQEHHGRPNQEHNSGRQHSGRASNQRPNSERQEESRPSYGHHHNGGDDDDEDDSAEHRGRPSSSGQYRPSGQTSNRHPQEAKPPAPPAVRTFHNYNFPPTPDYSRDADNNNDNNNNNKDNRRPPPPVKEPDTLAYYTYVTPVVGNRGIYYRSEKEMILRNNTMSVE